jgi:hypothetical protein
VPNAVGSYIPWNKGVRIRLVIFWKGGQRFPLKAFPTDLTLHYYVLASEQASLLSSQKGVLFLTTHLYFSFDATELCTQYNLSVWLSALSIIDCTPLPENAVQAFAGIPKDIDDCDVLYIFYFA